jgi:hypothetical protein
MKFNFKFNYLLLLLLVLFLISCFCFQYIISDKETFNNRFLLPESFEQNFRKIGEKDNYSYYLLDNPMKNFYLKNNVNATTMDNQFNIIKQLDASKNNVNYPSFTDDDYNYYFTNIDSLYFRNYQTLGQPSLPIIIDLSSTSIHSTINGNMNLIILLNNNQADGNDLEVYDLSKNIFSIDLKIDNSPVILNGKIVGTKLKDISTNNISDTSLNINDLPPALVSQLLGLNQINTSTIGRQNNTTNSIELINNSVNNSGMLSTLPTNFSHNSPYYNNSFEYAMNSLSNPIVNKLYSNNPVEQSQLMLDNKNVKDVCTLCNSCKGNNCNCCNEKNRLPNYEKRKTNSDENISQTKRKNIEKNINKTNETNIQNKINENSKIGRKFSSLDSNMTMFNTTADLNDKTQTNFTPSLLNSSLNSDLPRPMLANFSTF